MQSTDHRVGLLAGIVTVAVGALLVAALPGGCDATGPGSTGQATRALTTESRLSLTPRARWRRLNPDSAWLVSPRFVRDGSLLLLSGRGGKGLFVASPTGPLQVIDPTYRGPVELDGAGRVLCLPNRDTVDAPRPGPEGLMVAGAQTCPPVPFDPEMGQELHDGASGRWTHHPLRGELVFRSASGRTVLVDHRVPWSIRVSPDGRRVAYSVGRLPSPTLFLWDEERGHRSLGTGVHAVFHPDGLLIYSRPDGALYLGGLTTVARADLRAHDLDTDVSWNLTDTPDLAEMEPAISPDGRRLAFADWRRGGAYLVTLNRRVDR